MLVELHQHLTGERHHRVHVPRRRDGPGEVRHDADLVVVAERHDLQHLGDAAHVRQRGAREVDIALFDKRTEIRAGAPFLTRRQRHRRQQPELRNLRTELLLAQRVLHAVRSNGLHQPAQFHGFVEVEALVQVDHPVAVAADTLADLRHRLDDLGDAGARVERSPTATSPSGGCARRTAAAGSRTGPTPARGRRRGPPGRRRANRPIHTIDAVARLHRRPRSLSQAHGRELGRRNHPGRHAQRGVQFEVLTRLPAEQLIERHVERLALDVPQCEVDRTERVQAFLAGRVEPVHEAVLPDVFGVEGVLADDAARHVAHGIGRAALPDARDAFLRIDQHNHVALGKGLGPVGVVVGRIEHADLRHGVGRQPRSRTGQCRRRAGWRGQQPGHPRGRGQRACRQRE